MERAIIHVDMDAFYASVEQRDYPIYKNKPIAVGGSPSARGVVCAASYEARKFGVRSAMPSKKAQQLCPNLIFVPPRMDKYIEVSKEIHKIFEQYSDWIEPISIDEAFLDVTGKDAVKVAQEIKKRIKNEIGLTASIGISMNKYLAKLASDYNKPDGFKVIKKEEIEKFLGPLPVRKIWGVGPKTERELNKLGLYRIKDVLKYDKMILIEKFGKKGLEIFNYAKGKDDRLVENKHKRKTIGEENTFPKDTCDMNVLKKTILDHCHILVHRLKKSKLLIKTVTVKIKYEDFSIITRSITLPQYTQELQQIYGAAESILLHKVNTENKIRLLGVQVSNILYPDEPMQLEMKIDNTFYMK
ncbi:DNA polymerase IV [Clostridiaceae bacterium 35-E11]